MVWRFVIIAPGVLTLTNPVRIRGVNYPSQTTAAKALKVSPKTILRSLNNGTIDHVGLRKKNPIGVTIHGTCYRSNLAAANVLGVKLRDICGWLRVERIHLPR